MVSSQWHSDCMSLGSTPYIRPGNDATDYDIFAQPVKYEQFDGAEPARLYFAGDHTHRQYPGTLQGAYLSGLRAAQQVADQFLGTINDPEYLERYERLGKQFLEIFPVDVPSDDDVACK